MGRKHRHRAPRNGGRVARGGTDALSRRKPHRGKTAIERLEARELLAKFAMIGDFTSGTPLRELGNFTWGQVILILMGTVGVLFLIIQLVALGMGLDVVSA